MRPDGASGRPTGREDRPLLSPILGKGRDFETGETGQQDIMRGNDVADTNVGGRRQERRKRCAIRRVNRIFCTLDTTVLLYIDAARTIVPTHSHVVVWSQYQVSLVVVSPVLRSDRVRYSVAVQSRTTRRKYYCFGFLINRHRFCK